MNTKSVVSLFALNPHWLYKVVYNDGKYQSVYEHLCKDFSCNGQQSLISRSLEQSDFSPLFCTG